MDTLDLAAQKNVVRPTHVGISVALIAWLRANALTVLTATVAVYGAVLSTLNYRHARTEKARMLTVRLTWGYLGYSHGMGNRLSECQCLLHISNPGHTSVVVRSFSLLAGKLSVIIPAENCEAQRLPHELAPGQGINAWIEASEVAVGLAQNGLSGKIKLRARVSDATGKDFHSKGVEFDIDGFRRAS